jgi:hypothetical protein
MESNFKKNFEIGQLIKVTEKIDNINYIKIMEIVYIDPYVNGVIIAFNRRPKARYLARPQKLWEEGITPGREWRNLIRPYVQKFDPEIMDESDLILYTNFPYLTPRFWELLK